MGAWWYGIFENDQAWDAATDIEKEAAVIIHEHIPLLYRPTELVPKIRWFLNEGGLLMALRKLYEGEFQPEQDGNKLNSVMTFYLGAIAMHNGAILTDSHRRVLHGALSWLDIFGDAREQMETALGSYDNSGKPYDFKNKSLDDSLMDPERWPTKGFLCNVDIERFGSYVRDVSTLRGRSLF